MTRRTLRLSDLINICLIDNWNDLKLNYECCSKSPLTDVFLLKTRAQAEHTLAT